MMSDSPSDSLSITVLDSFEPIRALSKDARRIFESMLLSAIGSSATSGACLHAAIFLSITLSKFADATTLVCGGGPPMDGGLWDADGVCHGHYWVEGRTADDQPFLADISADQFGFPTVVVLPLAQARARYSPGNAQHIAQHVTDETAQWV